MSESDSEVWKGVKVIINAVISTTNEIYRLIPDSILFGSILLYFLTQNIAFGIFAVFIFETVLSHRFIGWMFSQTVGSSRSSDIKCHTGYRTPRFDVQRMFLHEPYPSYGVFSITAIGTYLGLAMSEFSSTLKAMGSEWESRSTVAYILIAIVTLAFTIVRKMGCDDNISEILIAAVLAIIVGLLFFYVNRALFGKESMNFLGLPYMVSKDSQGSPIYVCAKENDPTSA